MIVVQNIASPATAGIARSSQMEPSAAPPMSRMPIAVTKLAPATATLGIAFRSSTVSSRRWS